MRRAVIPSVAALALAGARLPAQAPVDSARPPAAIPSAPVRAPDRWVGEDKLKHFLIAGLVQGTTFGAVTAAGARRGPAMGSASAVTAVVSVGKELRDRRRGGRASGRDLVWDAAGAALWGALLARSGR
jgi:uncharacterized protein YfiM (DUF2279 family)